MKLEVWIATFVLGITFFIAGIIYLGIRGAKEKYFFKAGIFEYIASVILYIPQAFYNDIPKGKMPAKIVETIFISLLRIFTGNKYERVKIEGYSTFNNIYATLMIIVNLTLIFFIGGIFAKFFSGRFQQILLALRKRKDAYIFFGCNEKTLAIASSVGKEKANYIFANISKNTKLSYREKISEIGGIHVENSVSQVFKKIYKKSTKIEIFLFGDSEEDNLLELETICAEIAKHKIINVKVYVELLDTPWDIYNDFLDKHNTDNVRISFVRTEANFAYNNLFNNSIFKDAKEADGIRYIKFLIVGMNERNMEMFKGILHLGQMPGYRLDIMVLDEGRMRNVLREQMPEVLDLCDKEGDAIYQIRYHEHIKMESDEMIQALYGFEDFTFAFINMKDDIQNLNVAMRLNRMRMRKGDKGKYKIQAVCENKNLYKNRDEKSKSNVQFIGSKSEVYNYKFITMPEVEEASKKIHDIRFKDGLEVEEWNKSCNKEYNRHSEYARTLSLKYKILDIDRQYGNKVSAAKYADIENEEKWRIYEHMRWNMYMRTNGYIFADRDKVSDKEGNIDRDFRRRAKMHNCLINYFELPQVEKDKDGIMLTKAVVEILKNQ